MIPLAWLVPGSTILQTKVHCWAKLVQPDGRVLACRTGKLGTPPWVPRVLRPPQTARHPPSPDTSIGAVCETTSIITSPLGLLGRRLPQWSSLASKVHRPTCVSQPL